MISGIISGERESLERFYSNYPNFSDSCSSCGVIVFYCVVWLFYWYFYFLYLHKQEQNLDMAKVMCGKVSLRDPTKQAQVVGVYYYKVIPCFNVPFTLSHTVSQKLKAGLLNKTSVSGMQEQVYILTTYTCSKACQYKG